MQEIPLQALPNQRFTATLDGTLFALHLQTLPNGTCVASIARDNETVIRGVRVMPNRPIIPYRYHEGDAGNFAMLTPNDEYPVYTEFGITQTLVYASAEELDALRG